MYCTNCGIQIEPKNKFCSNCGHRIEADVQQLELQETSDEARVSLEALKTKWGASVQRMSKKRVFTGMKKEEPTKTVALHVKILDGKMKMVQRAFKDDMGIDRGYVRIDVQMNSTCRDWMRSVRACFQPSPDLHPYISTSKGNLDKIDQSYSFKQLRNSQKEKKVASTKYAIYFQIKKSRHAIVGSYLRYTEGKRKPAPKVVIEIEDGNESEVNDEDNMIDNQNVHILRELESESNDKVNREGDELWESDLEDPALDTLIDELDVSEIHAVEECPDKSPLSFSSSNVQALDMVLDKKRQRKSVAEGISLKLPEGNRKYITVVYQEHGGISMTRQFGENDTLQVLYTWICMEMDPEILPPKFHLGCHAPEKCTDDDCDHSYVLTPDSANYKIYKHTPTLLFIKEDVCYNLILYIILFEE
ncbi:unnamed protein product [Mytilus coruscus]|uniref:Zinc-ribbon domain-containing protein n=1 Tax=Mytilus coruscus TaxID=42192 RepID=A0A6J8E4Z5_MYTCO|nr:unnamed protein product [Mytilus coruscus]